MYDFTSHIDRCDTGSYKWDEVRKLESDLAQQVVPMSVADMEFNNPPEIKAGLKEFIDNNLFGYEGPRDNFFKAVVNWQAIHHHWQIEKDWILTTPGVVVAINLAIKTFTQKGDGVIVFTPVYGPFQQTVIDNGRQLLAVPLIENNNYYSIDFELFDKIAARSQAKMLLFCSPHNPVGRVWKREELEKVAAIAKQHDLLVFSDELWNDLLLNNHQHTVLASLNDDMKMRTLTGHGASKSFNLAGMHTSTIIIANESIRKQFSQVIEKQHLSVNTLGYEATRLAYTEGEAWLSEVLSVIEKNQSYVHEFFANYLPEIKAPISEGTYTQWLDFRSLDLSADELQTKLTKDAHIFLSDGMNFGDEGKGFARINVALPKADLEENLKRFYQVFRTENSKK